LPDLHLICRYLYHENKRSGREHHGGGTFLRALQSGLAHVLSTSNTWTQLTLHMPADPFPPSRGGGTALGCPLYGAAKRSLTRSHVQHHGWLYPKSGMCRRRESDGDQQVLGRRPQLISTLQKEKQCRVRDLPPRDMPGPPPGTMSPAVGPTAPGFFPYLSLPSFP